MNIHIHIQRKGCSYHTDMGIQKMKFAMQNYIHEVNIPWKIIIIYVSSLKSHTVTQMKLPKLEDKTYYKTGRR